MQRNLTGAFALAAFLALGTAAPVLAQPAPGQQGGMVLPRDLMTAQDRLAYRQEMRQARTPEERAQVQERHWAQLQQRASERGMTLVEPVMRGGAGSWGEAQGEREPMGRRMASMRENMPMMLRAP